VIKTVDVIETETTIYLVTERVTPLSWHVKRKSLSPETIKWGLHSVATTLKFINGDASSVHGAVRVASIFANEAGEWKLGGFEVLSSLNEDDAVIYNYGTLLPDANRYAPPEVAANGWSVIKKHPLTAADAYGLGTLVYEAFNGVFHGTDQLTQPKSIPAPIASAYKRLISANPKVRLSPAHFLEQGKKAGSFFQTPLIHITESADNLGLMNHEERDDFLQELDKLSDDFPEDFFKSKILPELLKSVEFGGGGPSVVSAVMKISIKMTDDEFETRLTPVLLRLFQMPDRQIRVALLDHLPLMIDRLSQKDINGKVWPAMTTGFTDTAPVIREQTVKAVLVVIVKLADRTINGELLRFLAKTANDEQPGIRTNTTICLGKIARNLGSASRAKVLIAAFTRSLRDPFVHARMAALMALNATLDVFSEDDCAGKLLPVLCQSLVDKEKIVRDQANKTFDTYLARVRKYATTLPETALPPETANNAAAAPARIGNQSDSSWAGWAISSFTNKLTTAKGEMQSAAPTNGSATHAQSLPPSGRATPTVQVHRPASAAPPVAKAAQASSNTNLMDDTADFDNDDEVLDAWGEMDEEEDNFFDAPAAKSTKSKPGPGATSPPAAAYDDGGEPDFAGWLAAQSKAKTAGKAAPKGLTKAATNTTNTSKLAPRPAAPGRSASAGVVTAPKANVVAVKKDVLKPKVEKIDDDDWGAAWD
jgi:SCY1-like protein 1